MLKSERKKITDNCSYIANDYYKEAKKTITEGGYSFFLRTKKQQEYHPDNVGQFTDKRYEIAYTLQDMACLCTSPAISNFVVDMASRLRENNAERTVSPEDLAYIVEFISKGKEQYRKSSTYIDLDEVNKIVED